MLPHQRLLNWLELEDEQQQLEQFTHVFAPDAALDGELVPWDRVLDMLEVQACLRDVRSVLAEGCDTHGVVVLEGRDPVTSLWHRKAWAFTARDGLVQKVALTTSQGLPSPQERSGGRPRGRP
ncbi:hypothetical protein ATI61_101861 [Archangium gephyra]|uniref:Nuclear transport factor 2 family protein n=1 Tax=Archangium gephyra TaxID=48 RepID=A0ABX9KCR5_9BACT|nr:hypothetical protein [Archangium gephyra]REG37874.1 hypothetical protein ATI61_101861 [Archangium gephyra]